jgi:hypothetical protein
MEHPGDHGAFLGFGVSGRRAMGSSREQGVLEAVTVLGALLERHPGDFHYAALQLTSPSLMLGSRR